MVVSLTVVPVLASRFLANRPMPASGPIYRLMADVYEGALRRALRWPRLVMVLAVLAVVPGWWFWTRLDSGFMPEMDEGAFVLDYLMPPGTSLTQTDKVARRIDKILLETPDVAGYLRRTGAENGIYATEAFKGDIDVALKPAGQRRPYEEIKEELEEKLKDEVPEADTEITPLIRDQINDLNGIMKPVEVKIFGPDLAVLRDLAEKVGNVLEGKGSEEGRYRKCQHPCRPGQSGYHCAAGPRGARPCRPDGAGPGEPAQRGPLRPGCCHAAGERPHHRHPRPRSGQDPPRSRSRGADSHRGAAGREPARRRDRAAWASSCCGSLPLSRGSEVPTNCGARTSSR